MHGLLLHNLIYCVGYSCLGWSSECHSLPSRHILPGPKFASRILFLLCDQKVCEDKVIVGFWFGGGVVVKEKVGGWGRRE